MAGAVPPTRHRLFGGTWLPVVSVMPAERHRPCFGREISYHGALAPTSPQPPCDAAPEVFAVSRRFDLATVLVAMLAYACLFSVLRFAGAPPVVIGFVGAFFAVVAVGQAIAIRWQSPRAASIIAGTLYWWALAAVLAFAVAGGACEFCGLSIAAFVLGPATGYLGGALVGGVFLLSHYLRESQLLGRRNHPAAHEEESPWSAASDAVEDSRNS
jgi:hypothetical protein